MSARLHKPIKASPVCAWWAFDDWNLRLGRSKSYREEGIILFLDLWAEAQEFSEISLDEQPRWPTVATIETMNTFVPRKPSTSRKPAWADPCTLPRLETGGLASMTCLGWSETARGTSNFERRVFPLFPTVGRLHLLTPWPGALSFL